MKKLFDQFPYLENDRIIIKRMTDDDANTLFQMTQNKNVYRYLPTFLLEKQYDDMIEVIHRSYAEKFLMRESVLMGVYFKNGNSFQFCGIAEIYHYNETLSKVTIGYRLTEDFWGKGIATELIDMLVTYLFCETDIEVIIASHITDNPASGKVLQKNGFKRIASCVEEDWGFDEKTFVDKWCLSKSDYIIQKS